MDTRSEGGTDTARQRPVATPNSRKGQLPTRTPLIGSWELGQRRRLRVVVVFQRRLESFEPEDSNDSQNFKNNPTAARPKFSFSSPERLMPANSRSWKVWK